MEPLARPRLVAVLAALAVVASAAELISRDGDPLLGAIAIALTGIGLLLLPRHPAWAAVPIGASGFRSSCAMPAAVVCATRARSRLRDRAATASSRVTSESTEVMP